MESEGWRLFVHPLFHAQLEKLTKRVERLASRNPEGYASHPATKILTTINHYIREAIPRDPNSPEFRQGNTLGPDNRHWFRAKFHQRYRLFFRFSTKDRVIVYVWVNDEFTLRKAGSKTDAYAVFKSMLNAGDPPRTLEALLKPAKEMRGDAKRGNAFPDKKD